MFVVLLAIASFLCNIVAAFGGGGWWFLTGFILFWVMMIICMAVGAGTVSVSNAYEIGDEVHRAVSNALREEREKREGKGVDGKQ